MTLEKDAATTGHELAEQVGGVPAGHHLAQVKRVTELMDRLQTRAAFVEKLRGSSYAEIAKMLDISKGTAHTWYAESLRDWRHKEGVEDDDLAALAHAQEWLEEGWAELGQLLRNRLVHGQAQAVSDELARATTERQDAESADSTSRFRTKLLATYSRTLDDTVGPPRLPMSAPLFNAYLTKLLSQQLPDDWTTPPGASPTDGNAFIQRMWPVLYSLDAQTLSTIMGSDEMKAALEKTAQLVEQPAVDRMTQLEQRVAKLESRLEGHGEA